MYNTIFVLNKKIWKYKQDSTEVFINYLNLKKSLGLSYVGTFFMSNWILNFDNIA